MKYEAAGGYRGRPSGDRRGDPFTENTGQGEKIEVLISSNTTLYDCTAGPDLLGEIVEESPWLFVENEVMAGSMSKLMLYGDQGKRGRVLPGV